MIAPGDPAHLADELLLVPAMVEAPRVDVDSLFDVRPRQSVDEVFGLFGVNYVKSLDKRASSESESDNDKPL